MRLPPHDAESERALVSCVLERPAVLPDILEIIGGPEAFYMVGYGLVFRAFVEMDAAGTPIDPISLKNHIGPEGLKRLGGLTAISEALSDHAIPSNAESYAAIVANKYHARRMAETCQNAVSRLYEANGDTPEVLDAIQSELMQVGHNTRAKAMPTMRDLVHQATNIIEDIYNRKGAISGLDTGFPDFNSMTDGLHAAEMIVIAGRPSMGKTSLAMNMVEHVACDLQKPVGVFSLEMTGVALVTRMLLCRAQQNLRAVQRGFLSDRDFPKISIAASALSKAPIHVDDSAGLPVMQFRARARRMHQQHKLALIVADYLQLFTTSGHQNRAQEVGAISSAIKNTAKELGIPIIVLSQLNRDVERDKNRKPRLADLRESGGIEQDADLVGFLYKVEPDNDQEQDAIPVNLLIAKQRNGPTGDVELIFRRSMTRFESCAKVSEE